MLHSYKAWIPTVNGRLSFRVVGEAQFPQVAEYSNITSSGHQYIIVKQERNLSDVLFSDLLSRIDLAFNGFISRLIGINGKFAFFFVARARADISVIDAKLLGRVYLYRVASSAYSEVKREFDNKIKICRRIERGEPVGIKDVYLQVHASMATASEIFADVIIRRNGIFTVKNIKWGRNALQENSFEFGARQEFDIDHIVADQLYFFVRDIVHQHQHHSPDADTIITTHPVDGVDTTWCAKVIFSLYYHIITIKRSKDNAEQIRAVGVLAYINSFERIAKAVGCKNLPSFYSDTAKQSIEASKGYLELKIARKTELFERSRTFALWFVSAAISILVFVARFADNDSPKDKWAVWIANLTQEYASLLVLLPVAAIFIIYLSNRILSSTNLVLREILGDFVRLIIFNRIVFSLLIILIVVLIVIFLIVPSIENIIRYFAPT